MQQYLIILLDQSSTSYCHYQVPATDSKSEGLIPLETLRAGIVFAMKENLNIQFVYPDYPLPEEYIKMIESIDHTKIKPWEQAFNADVITLTQWEKQIGEACKNATCMIHASRRDLKSNVSRIEELLRTVSRLNIVLTDIEDFRDEDIEDYQQVLEVLTELLVEEYRAGHYVQLNLLTDRLTLTEMNNCGAGDTNITLAPNGCFYLCPAFYYTDQTQSVGALNTGLDIKNRQLLRLDHAPICRHCDAYQCKRCIWMNSRLTLDYNTPSHQQCVIAHLERNASCELKDKMKAIGIHLNEIHEIEKIDELDPFNKYKLWK